MQGCKIPMTTKAAVVMVAELLDRIALHIV